MKYQGEERRKEGMDSWHLHISVPLGIIGAILVQCGCFIWYGAQLDLSVKNTSIRVDQLESWKAKQDDQLAKLNANQSAYGQKLDDLVATVHHTDDIIEKYFYHK
jgi:cell division protein FtsB